jgi:hypothetical protein
VELPDIFEWIVVDGILYEREGEEKKFALCKYVITPV